MKSIGFIGLGAMICSLNKGMKIGLILFFKTSKLDRN